MVGDDERTYPCAGALPVGFCWSLYFAQTVNEHALQEVEGIEDVSVMHDRTQPCVLSKSPRPQRSSPRSRLERMERVHAPVAEAT